MDHRFDESYLFVYIGHVWKETIHHQGDAFNINLLIQRILNMSSLYLVPLNRPFYDVIWLQRPEIILFPYII